MVAWIARAASESSRHAPRVQFRGGRSIDLRRHTDYACCLPMPTLPEAPKPTRGRQSGESWIGPSPNIDGGTGSGRVANRLGVDATLEGPPAPDRGPSARPGMMTMGVAETGATSDVCQRGTLRETIVATLTTTAIVTATSYIAPRAHAASLVGMGFLVAVWLLVLRKDAATIRAYGLALGGLLEPAPIDVKRLARSFVRAACWALLASVLTFPAFFVGYMAYFQPTAQFALHWPPAILDEVAGQLTVVALPEEAFFRGYLQTSLNRAFPARWRLLGATVGPGWLLTAAVFALGHMLTDLRAARLAVFFPALLFGWLRQRVRGIGAPVLFHAACNLFSATVARSYDGA